jgi:hypothetical protein
MDVFGILSSGAKFTNKPKFSRKPLKKEVIDSTIDQNLKKEICKNEIIQELDFFNKKSPANPNSNQSSNPNRQDPAPVSIPLTTREEIKDFRTRNKIRVFGTDVANPIQSFNELVQE